MKKISPKLLTVLIVAVLLLASGSMIYFFIYDPFSERTKITQTTTNIAPVSSTEQLASTIKYFENINDQTYNSEKIKEMGDKAEDIASVGDAAIDPILKELNHGKLEVRWLAVYVLARLAHGTPPSKQIEIREALNNLVDSESNLALKRQAAAPIYGLGNKSVKPILEECARGKNDFILFSEPPESLNNLCSRTLEYYNK